MFYITDDMADRGTFQSEYCFIICFSSEEIQHETEAMDMVGHTEPSVVLRPSRTATSQYQPCLPLLHSLYTCSPPPKPTTRLVDLLCPKDYKPILK